MKTNYIVALTIFLVVIVGNFKAEAQQSIFDNFYSNGIQRGFTGAIPNNPQTPLRVVILFHGTGENQFEMEARGFNTF